MSQAQHPSQIYRAMLFHSPKKGHRHLTRAPEQWSYYYYCVYSSPNLSHNMSMQTEQQSNESYNIIFAVCFRQYGWVRSLPPQTSSLEIAPSA